MNPRSLMASTMGMVEKQQERDAEAKIRREPGPAPGELDLLLFFLAIMKPSRLPSA
jgi:hypothetical protein